MSAKSYTLADGSTATVNATDSGVPFNEGMSILSKAIKAKITASSGGASSGKLEPTLTMNGLVNFLDGDSYAINYDGDGLLSLGLGGFKNGSSSDALTRTVINDNSTLVLATNIGYYASFFIIYAPETNLYKSASFKGSISWDS